MNSGDRSAASRVSSERIARLLGRNASRVGGTSGKTTDREGCSDSGAHGSGRAGGDPADLEEAQGPAGTFLARRHVFERDTLHGSWRLGEVQGLDARAFSLLLISPCTCRNSGVKQGARVLMNATAASCTYHDGACFANHIATVAAVVPGDKQGMGGGTAA